ncbi:MAG: polysaccharide biosynthesis protein, partial [Fimbriimonadaceae bacterium]|nr:polysaccharide biosynthesis protein [Fimbriimonadaceae bacterium]
LFRSLGGWRLGARLLSDRSGAGASSQPTRRVLIIGASHEGEAVCRELNRLAEGAIKIVGYVDDRDENQNTTVQGLTVLGRITDIPKIAEKHRVNEILISTPDLAPSELRRIFDICSGTRSRIRMVPSFRAIVGGSDRLLSRMRSLDVRDLLRRDSIKGDESISMDYIHGERVLITGGGGSIGSELARQVAKLSPASLVLMGKGEGSIFEIDQEIRRTTPLRPSAVITDVRDKAAIATAMAKEVPTVVFHAAAHKHVPLMEAVPIEAIMNNVFGTLNMVEASITARVKKFILVSTDKAVKPANVMGATKRVAEMIVASKSAVSDTEFAIVRFGNVLNSRGSLVPLIQKQIEAGGPVTVTHPDMTRFFMTIPEASELILNAGALGGRGEIFVLDMGAPVKIEELVKDVIRLHGLVPGQDIEVVYSGIRPGEKIHEELYFANENVSRSRHPKIHVADQSIAYPWAWLSTQLDELRSLCLAGDVEGARSALMELAWGKNAPLFPEEEARVAPREVL